MVYRTAPFSITLNNPTPTFQGQAIIILMLNICEMAADIAIVTMEGQYERVCYLSNGAISIGNGIKWCHFQ